MLLYTRIVEITAKFQQTTFIHITTPSMVNWPIFPQLHQVWLDVVHWCLIGGFKDCHILSWYLINSFKKLRRMACISVRVTPERQEECTAGKTLMTVCVEFFTGPRKVKAVEAEYHYSNSTCQYANITNKYKMQPQQTLSLHTLQIASNCHISNSNCTIIYTWSWIQSGLNFQAQKKHGIHITALLPKNRIITQPKITKYPFTNNGSTKQNVMCLQAAGNSIR